MNATVKFHIGAKRDMIATVMSYIGFKESVQFSVFSANSYFDVLKRIYLIFGIVVPLGT
jgi:hypothetical protein